MNEMKSWSRWTKPKMKTNWKMLWIVIALFLFFSFYFYVVWYSDNTYAVIQPMGVVVENTPEYGTKSWLTMCYNEYQTYEERISLCG